MTRFDWRDPLWLAGLLLSLAILAGGGGVSAALGNLAVQIAALVVLGMCGAQVGRFVTAAPASLRLLFFASLALPLLQIVPLPPAVWEALPGRDMIGASLDLSGGRGWFPMSMEPARTLLAALGLIAPAAVLAIGWTLTPDRIVHLQKIAIALGVIAALFGSLHLFNDDWGDLYSWQRPLPGILVGTFADRNAAALFFVGCLLLLVGLPALPRETGWRLVAGAVAVLLAVAVVLTKSRSGIALMALPALLGLWRMARAFRMPGGRGRWPLLAAGLVAFVGAVSIVSMSGRAQASLDRFDNDDGMRAEMREDALFAARHYWPVGSGMGTFDAVFQVDESLAYVTPRRAGHAHMDYYELAIEAGIAGLAILAAWLAWVAWHGWLTFRRERTWAARGGFLFLCGIAAQSLVSFPMRSQAMLCMAALAIVLLVRSPVAASGGRVP